MKARHNDDGTQRLAAGRVHRAEEPSSSPHRCQYLCMQSAALYATHTQQRTENGSLCRQGHTLCNTLARGRPRKPSYSSASPRSTLGAADGLELPRSLPRPLSLLVALRPEAEASDLRGT